MAPYQRQIGNLIYTKTVMNMEVPFVRFLKDIKPLVYNAALWLVGWLVVLRIYVALAVFQPYSDLEAGDNQSLKS